MKTLPQGFTLIELIIYIGIAAGVLLTFTLFILHIAGTRNKTFAVEEVQASGRIALENISARIRDATGINAAGSVFGSDPGALSLAMSDVPTRNPIVIGLTADDGILQIQEGTNAPVQITSPQVRVTNLVFTDLSPVGGRRNIRIQLTVAYDNPSGDSGFSYSASWSTAVSTRQ